jgi:hypothetical protein
MGVAAIFPVGNHYVVEGEKYDLGASIAQNAFEELKARRMLRPEAWLYADSVPGTMWPVINPSGAFSIPFPGPTDPVVDTEGPGFAFVIDPLGSANQPQSHFPFRLQSLYVPRSGSGYSNLWSRQLSALNGFTGVNTGTGTVVFLPGRQWPVRRVTLPIPNPAGGGAPPIPMTNPVGETIFRLRDELAVDQPEESDRPSLQRWDTSGTALLRRQYKGNYSWLATVVPTSREGVDALQPAHPAYGQIDCDVSVVVYRKRDETPSDESERFLFGELLPGGELVMFLPNSTTAKNDVDTAVDGIKPGNWIALTGINQSTIGSNHSTSDFVMKWYRILSLEDETTDVEVKLKGDTANQGRRAMLLGPDWPTSQSQRSNGYVGAVVVCIAPEVMSVVTKPLKMESSSLWQLD